MGFGFQFADWLGRPACMWPALIGAVAGLLRTGLPQAAR